MSRSSLLAFLRQGADSARVPYRYGPAVAAALLAVVLRWLLAPIVGDLAAFVLDYSAVLFAAWYGGLGPGLLVTISCTVATAWVILPPRDSLWVAGSADQLSVGVFLLIGTLISLANGELHRRRRRAEDALATLRRERMRKGALLDASPDATMGLDGSGRIQEWNATAARLFGHSRSDALGRDVAELIAWAEPGGTRSNGIPPDLKAEAGRGLSRAVLVTGHRSDGSEFPAELTVAAITIDGAPYYEAFLRDMTERRAAEEALSESQTLFREFMEHSPAVSYIRDDSGKLVYVNAAYERFHGRSAAELHGTCLTYLADSDLAERLQGLYDRIVAGEPFLEAQEIFPDAEGKQRECSFFLFPIQRADGRRFLGGIALDVSEQRSLERQLRQSQKMDAVGQLAGGIAHDFNNVLGVVTGYSELLLFAGDLTERQAMQVAEIQKAGERAASLTRQLLAFSRQQVLAPQHLDLNEIVRGMTGMLRRLIGEDIDMALVPGDCVGKVDADPGQVEQVVLNLAVNARDAMPTGGKLTFETAAVELDAAYVQLCPAARLGRHVCLAVSDTGCGMEKEVLERIFEPFFTTKPTGKGTGIGLATVFGIVRQSGGHITVYSEPGVGTTFRVYLPAVADSGRARVSFDSASVLSGGTETILVAEDDAQLRALVIVLLKEWGYRVLAAETPACALELAASHEGVIDLLLTDVVMPGMGGRELAEQLLLLRPGLRVLFTSGYTDDAVVRHGVLTAGVDFVQKPFTPLQLSRKLRQVLSAAPTRPSKTE